MEIIYLTPKGIHNGVDNTIPHNTNHTVTCVASTINNPQDYFYIYSFDVETSEWTLIPMEDQINKVVYSIRVIGRGKSKDKNTLPWYVTGYIGGQTITVSNTAKQFTTVFSPYYYINQSTNQPFTIDEINNAYLSGQTNGAELISYNNYDGALISLANLEVTYLFTPLSAALLI